jgi:hypothetical protein
MLKGWKQDVWLDGKIAIRGLHPVAGRRGSDAFGESFSPPVAAYVLDDGIGVDEIDFRYSG